MRSEHVWPSRLWLVRHGESLGNVARAAADAAAMARIAIPERDVDGPLSDCGVQQAAALGRWFAGLEPLQRPQVVLSSPYLRAVKTAQILREQNALIADAPALAIDERLREREFGILDRLTRVGVT